MTFTLCLIETYLYNVHQLKPCIIMICCTVIDVSPWDGISVFMMHNVLVSYSLLVSSLLSKAWFGQIFTYSLPPFISAANICTTLSLWKSTDCASQGVVLLPILPILGLHFQFSKLIFSLVTGYLLRSLSCLFFPSLGTTQIQTSFLLCALSASLPYPVHPNSFLSAQNT